MSSELKKASVGPVFAGGILVFLLFVLIVLVCFRLLPKSQSYEDKRAAARAEKLNLLQKENHEKLSSYAWINKEKGIVQLPVEFAAELVLGELKAKTVHPSTVKVENPYPAGLQQPPPAPAAPAPGASPLPGAPAAASPTPAAPATATPAVSVPAASSTPVPGSASSSTPAPASSPATALPPATPAPATSVAPAQ
jgi:hypothetical protein